MWSVLEPETLVIDSPLSFEEASARIRALIEAEAGTVASQGQGSRDQSLHCSVVRKWTEDTHAFSLEVKLRPCPGGSQAVLASRASVSESWGLPLLAVAICAITAYQYGWTSWVLGGAVLLSLWLLYDFPASYRRETRRLRSPPPRPRGVECLVWRSRPPNNALKRTRRCSDGASPLNAVLCGPLGRRDMARMTHRARASLSRLPSWRLQVQGRCVGRRAASWYAVLALPSADSVQTSGATNELAQAVATELQSAGLRVVVAGSPTAAPLEELAAVANAAAVDVAVGVQSLGRSAGCARVVKPKAVSRPRQRTSEANQVQPAAH